MREKHIVGAGGLRSRDFRGEDEEESPLSRQPRRIHGDRAGRGVIGGGDGDDAAVSDADAGDRHPLGFRDPREVNAHIVGDGDIGGIGLIDEETPIRRDRRRSREVVGLDIRRRTRLEVVRCLHELEVVGRAEILVVVRDIDDGAVGLSEVVGRVVGRHEAHLEHFRLFAEVVIHERHGDEGGRRAGGQHERCFGGRVVGDRAGVIGSGDGVGAEDEPDLARARQRRRDRDGNRQPPVVLGDAVFVKRELHDGGAGLQNPQNKRPRETVGSGETL